MILNEKTKNAIIGGLLIMFLAILFGAFVLLYSNSKQLDQTGRLLNEARGQLEYEISENNRLGEELRECQSRLNQCYYISEELREAVTRDIGNIRECIELVEEIRYDVMCLSYYTGYCDSDELYSRVDDYLSKDEIGVNINGNQE